MVPGRHLILTAGWMHLSTFLGHVDPTSTSVYLTITEELLNLAAQRFQWASPEKARVCAMTGVGQVLFAFFEDHLKTQKGASALAFRCGVIGTQ